MTPRDFFTADSVGRDDGVRGANESLTATPSGASQEDIYDLTRIIGAAYDQTAQDKLVFAIAPNTSSEISAFFGVTQDGTIFFKGLTEEFRNMADTARSWTLRVYVGSRDADLSGKVDYVDVDLRLRSLHDRFIYNHIGEDGNPVTYMDFVEGDGRPKHQDDEHIYRLHIEEETASLPIDHPGFNAVNGGIVDLTRYVPGFRDDRLLFAIDPAAPDSIKTNFTLDGEGVLYYTGPALDYETLAPADRTWMVRVFVASAEGFEGDDRPPGTPAYRYEGQLDSVILHISLRDIDETAPVIVREDVPGSYDAYEPSGTLTKTVSNIDDPDIVLFDFGIMGDDMGDDTTITWTTSSINSGVIYFKVDDEGKVRFSDAPTKLTGLDDIFDDDVGVRITATSAASGKSDSVDLAVRVLANHLQKEVLVNHSALLSATAEAGAFIIDLNTLYHIDYQDFAVAAPFSISDVVGGEDYGILKFTGAHSTHIDSYQVKVFARAVGKSATDFITIDVRLDGGDAVYTIGTTGADIRNPYVGDILSFTRTQNDPDGHNANVAETPEWFHADAPETTLATTPTYTIKAADLGKQIQLRVHYDDRFGAEGDEVSPTKDVATSIATGVVSAIGATAPYLETSARAISIPQSIAGIATAQSFTITDADSTAFTASSFTITGTQSSKFEIRQVNSEWRLALQPEQELDFADADEYTLSVHVTDEGGRASNSVDIVVSGAYYHVTGDGYDALARVVHVGDVLTAQQNYDAPTAPSGTRTYHWFHTDAPATAIGTAQEYTLKAADAGKQVQLRVTYTDAAGTHDSITLPPTTYVSASITASVPHLAVVGAPSVSIEDYLDGHVTEKTFIITDNNFDDRFSEESFTISGTQASKFKFEIRQSGQSNTIEWHLALKDGQWLTLDDGSQFTLSITVTDRDGHTSNSVDVLVSVQNTNNNAPVLSASNPTPTPITEGVAGVDSGYVFTYTDADSNNKFRFDIDGAAADKFEIVQDGAVWKLKLHDGKSLDYETDAVDGKVALEVKLNDGANDSNVVEVEIAVTNINDNAPEFPSTAYVINVVDDTPINTELFSFDATDLDGSALTYTPAPGSTIGGYLTLDADSGTLSLAQAMPTTYAHSFHIWVSDGKGSDSASVTVNSVRNTQPPTFAQATYTAAIGEDAVLGAEVFRLAATDGDVGTILTYSLVSVRDGNGVTFSGEAGLANARNPFAVDARTGAITLKSGLDYENVRGYVLVVKASDGNTDADASAQVSITVNNIEEGPATYSITRSGGGRDAPTPGATLYARRDASDPDGYAFQTAYGYEWFHVDTPDVVIGNANNYQVQTSDVGEQLRFRLKYRDAFGKDEAALSTEATISGIVRLANGDVIALVPSATSANIAENQVGANTDITFTIYDGTEHRFAPDDFQISGDQAGKFEIRVVNGAFTLALKPEESLNYEEADSLTLNVAVSHGGNSYAATALTINVGNVNESASYGFADAGSAHDAPEPYLTLIATRRTDDPEGHDGAEIYEWFHADVPNVLLGTGANYEVQAGDIGKQLRFRVKYSDNADNDEVVVADAISDVVASRVLVPSTRTAHINENQAGAISDITFAIYENVEQAYTPIEGTFAPDDFTITGNQANKFHIRDINGALTLALKPGMQLNHEQAGSLTLNVAVSRDGKNYDATLTVIVGDENEVATYGFATSGSAHDAPEPYLILIATRITDDPEGHDGAEIYEWFHVSAPDVVLDTGANYQVQESDIGKQLRFRVKYSDNSSNDESVLGGTSGVVAASGLGFTASATNATINENAAGAISNIILSPTLNDAPIPALTADNFTISGDQADKFEIREVNSAFTLALKPRESLDHETAGSLTLNVVLNHDGSKHPAPALTINVANLDEGAASYFIDNTEPTIYTTLTARQSTNDPDGRNLAIPQTYEWFYVLAPDTVIHTGETYQVQFSDLGKKINFRVKYRDEGGKDEVVEANTATAFVRIKNVDLGASATSATIDENSAGAFSDISFAPTIDGVLIKEDVRAITSLRVNGGGDRFEIVRDGAVWKLKLKPTESFNFEATSGDIALNVIIALNGHPVAAPLPVTISVGDVFEGDLGASATSATIDENIAGAFSGITFTPALNDVAFAPNRVGLNINDDTIGADRFEIVLDGAVWKLKLKPTEMFDFETNSDDIILNVVFSLDGEVQGAPLPITISVGNADEGHETLYLITPGDGRDSPDVGTVLYAQRSHKPFRIDPDGHDESVPEIFEWFHVGSPDVVIGTGASYKVQEGDVGEQLRFRAKYRDLSGTDEVVISSERSISGVVVPARLVLGESTTSGTINENETGGFSDITFTPLHNNVDITANINANSFYISSDQVHNFVIKQNNGVWTLKLSDGESFDAETTTAFNIKVQLLYGADISFVDLTVNIGNVDEGDARYFIAPGLGRDHPEPGTILTAQKDARPDRQDPDGYDDSVPVVIEWFHVDSPDVVIGTGENYTVQTSDTGEQIRFRAKYRDGSKTDEVVLSSDSSISGVVAVNLLTLTLSATSTTINENSAGAVSDLTLTPGLGDTAITLTSDSFRISGDADASKFIVAQNGGVWKLKLKTGMTLDAEATSSINLNIGINEAGNTSAIQTLTVNVGNVDEGRETPYFISSGARNAPEVGTILTAQRSTKQSNRDPDGHDDSVADQFEWFHVDSPDVTIGTGRTYTVQTSDIGEQLRFRATYRDLSGTDEVVLANTGSITGAVTLDGTARIALVATATTASIEENSAGASTDIEFSVYDGGEHAFTSGDFTVTGAESEHFEVARNDANNWHLRLIDGHALDYESTTSITLQVMVSDGANQSNAVNNIVISVIDQANEPVLLATLDLAAIYENHPIDKIIASIETPANLASAGGARLALASTGTNDNALFRLDAGKLYWKSAPDFETPQDADSDNNYEIDIIFTASDGTKYLQKHTLNTQDIGPGRHGYDATAKPDGGFGAYTLPYENVPQEARPIGLASYIIDGYAKIMPDTGPLIFTWSLDANSLYGASEVRVYLDEAFDAFEKAANLKFIEVASDSDIVINFQNRGTTGALGEAHPYITPMAINYYLNDKSDFEGTGFYRTLTHEIGHVLGLKHPFEDSAASTSWLLNLGYMNNDNTMMSYANAFGFIARGTPLLSADVAALQFLYGAPGGDGGDSAERFLKFEANRDYIHAVSERSVDWHPAKLIEISDALAIGTAFYNALHADTLSRLQSQISSIEYKSSTYTIDSTHGDAAFFEISESGAISLKQNLDADTPQDNYGSKAYVENNVYEIKINAVHIYKISSGGMHRSEDYGYLGIEVVDAANIVPLTLTLSATSTTINENSDGAVSDITLTPALDGTPITTLTADNFAIIGSEAYKFEVAPDAQNGGVWKLKLKTGESFDAETDTSPIGLNLFIYQNEKVSAIHTLTINVGNVDEGGETPYFIDNTNNVREAPEPGTILTAQRSTDRSKRDPDGHDNSVPDQFEWFHIDSPDVVIGTGKTYTVQTSDVGEQLRFRVTYRDLSGTDEMVLANAGSISGVVTLDGTARIALVASATTASIEENSAGVSTDIEFSVYDGGEHDFSSTDFTITGTESEHFEIARNQAGNWHLRLIDGHALNYESAASLTLQVRVSDGTNQSNSIDNITINVSNHDEGDATIAITGADVDVGTQLGITYTEDPDGLMAGTTLTYSWFYARDPDPDTSIGTGTTYTIKEDDRGEYIGVRVSYTDKLGAQQVVEDINEDPVPHLTVTTSAPEEDNTIDAHQDQASKIEAGDGADTITGGSRNDVIDGGLGDDVIDLGTTPDDADQVVYGIGDQTAADGGDHISGFNRGKDKFIFSLESNDETNKIQNYDDFLDYLTNGTPGNLRDDQFLVQLDVDYPNNEVNLEGIYLHFLDSTFFSGGRISMPFINIKFAEALDLKEIIEIFGTEMADIEGKFNPNGILMDLDYFDDLLGGDGFIGYEIV